MKIIYSKVLALFLAFVMCFATLTACGGFDDGERGPGTHEETAHEETKKIVDVPSPVVIPEGMDKDEVAYVYASVALDLMSYGYDVFNCVAESAGGCEYGLAYCDYETGYQFDNDKKTYLSSGFLSFSPNDSSVIQDKDTVFLYSVDENAVKAEDDIYGYVADFCEQGIPSGHFITGGKYVRYSVQDGNVQIESSENNPADYDLSLGSIYDYDIDDYVFIPYDDISSAPLEYVALTDSIDGERLKSVLYDNLLEQEDNGYTLQSITVAYISVDALNALKGVLSQSDSLNGYSFDYLNSIEYDSSSQYLCFNEDGTITLKDLPPLPATATKQLIDWIVDGLVLAGCAGIAVISIVYLGPAGPYISGAVVGAGMEYFNQTILQGEKFSEVNWAKVGIMAVSGALGAAVPCSGALGYLGSGLLGGLTSAAITAVDGGTLEECLISGAQGALISVIAHGLFSSCFVEGTMILTDKGLAAIETITAGTLVASYNARLNQTEYKPVLETYVNRTDSLAKVILDDGSTVVSTLDHLYYEVNSNTYIPAKELTADSVLLNSDGRYIRVKSTSVIDTDGVNVYNFSVEDNHNYYVSDCSVLVHNDCEGYQRSKAGRSAKSEALDDIMNGNPEKWGLNPKYADDLKIIEFVQENGRFPVMKVDGFQCEFAHAVDVSKIRAAYESGIISKNQYYEFISSSQNGILTSSSTHFNILHGQNYSNATDVQIATGLRPAIADYVQTILKAIGVA